MTHPKEDTRTLIEALRAAAAETAGHPFAPKPAVQAFVLAIELIERQDATIRELVARVNALTGHDIQPLEH